MRIGGVGALDKLWHNAQAVLLIAGEGVWVQVVLGLELA